VQMKTQKIMHKKIAKKIKCVRSDVSKWSPLLSTLSARRKYSHSCKQGFQHGRIARVYTWPQVLINLNLLE